MSAWISSEALRELYLELDGVIGRDAEDRRLLARVLSDIHQRWLDSIEHDATGRRPAEADHG